jgi:hypothetical protein
MCSRSCSSGAGDKDRIKLARQIQWVGGHCGEDHSERRRRELEHEKAETEFQRAQTSLG